MGGKHGIDLDEYRNPDWSDEKLRTVLENHDISVIEQETGKLVVPAEDVLAFIVWNKQKLNSVRNKFDRFEELLESQS